MQKNYFRNTKLCCLVMALIALLLTQAHASDVLQWRNNRDGIYHETDLLKSWPEEGPDMLWSVDNAGAGYSSPIIVGGTIYLTGVENRREFVTAYDLEGNKLWRTEYSDAWARTYPEARTTPTWYKDRLYVISGNGVAASLNAANGDLIWAKDVFEEYQGQPGRWGVAESPLVVDGRMIITTGGNLTTMVGLNINDGSLAWKTVTLNEPAAYVSPLFIIHNSIRQIVGVTANSIFGVNPADGNMKWHVNYNAISPQDPGSSARWSINCNTPIYKDGHLFITSGYGHTSVNLKLNEQANGASLAWQNDDLDTHHGHVVLIDGHLYGSNWDGNRNGNWLCVDWETGDTLYEENWHTKGAIIAADGMLYLYEEGRGNLGLAQATPEGLDVVSSFQITKGMQAHWSHPVISNGIMYLRRGPALMAFDISTAGE